MKEKPLKKYRFFDFFYPEGKWIYIEGTDKYDALRRNFGEEQARMILKTFKIERVYED